MYTLSLTLFQLAQFNVVAEELEDYQTLHGLVEEARAAMTSIDNTPASNGTSNS